MTGKRHQLKISNYYSKVIMLGQGRSESVIIRASDNDAARSLLFFFFWVGDRKRYGEKERTVDLVPRCHPSSSYTGMKLPAEGRRKADPQTFWG